MKMHYSHRMPSRRIAQLTGAFVLLPVLGLVGLGLYMLKAENVFEEKYLLHAQIGQSYGLEPGAPVRISGFPIGVVKRVEFGADGRIGLTFQLLMRYREMVREDSVALVEKPAIMVGQTQVVIVKGAPEKPVLQDGAFIMVREPHDQIAELMGASKPVLERVQATLERVDAITKEIQTATQTSNRILVKVEQSTQDLPAVMASVQRTMANVERTSQDLPQLTAAAKDLTGSLKKTVGAVDTVVADVKTATAKLPGIMTAAQESVDNVKAATENIKGISREAGPMVRSAQAALDDVNTIIRGAKKTFPVSSMVKNAEAAPAQKPGNGLANLRGDQVSR